MSRKRKWESAELNNNTYNDYYLRLKEIAINRFEWKGIPPTVDQRFIELTLYEMGYCLYFQDPIVGDLALTCTIGGKLDVYRYPMERVAFAVNGYNLSRDNSNSVLIFNNYMHTPTDLTIRLFARRLYEIERAIDVNVKGQKTPKLIKTSEQQRLTMKNLYMQYDGNEPFIFADKNIDINQIDVLDTTAPYVSDKLEVLKHNIWNEALTFLGVENSSQDKKERLVADETNGNNGAIELQRFTALNSRQQAADQINRMFGRELEVRFRSELISSLNTPGYTQLQPSEGGDREDE